MSASGQMERVHDVVQKFLQLKKESNKDISKRSAPYVPSDVTSRDSLDLLPAGGTTSSDDGSGGDDSKKIQNLYKRINELEVVNDSLRQKLSIEEGSMSDEMSNDTEKSDDDASVAQLKLQRDKLRVELNKSSEHKKKMEQYSIEAKQQAQRLSAENEQLKESLKKANFDMEQATESYRAESRKFKHHHSASTGSAKQTIFDRNIEHWIETARLHLINDEVTRLLKTQVDLISHSRTAAITHVDSVSTAVDNVNYEVKPDESSITVQASVLEEGLSLSISSVVIVGLPGAAKTNFIKQLFSCYSIKAPSGGDGKDVTLTTVDIERDSMGKVSWANCPGDSCDVLVKMLHSKCAERGANVVDLLTELASHDSMHSLSEAQKKSLYAFFNKFQKNLKAPKSQTATYGMSQIFDLSHSSTAYAQIPVLFSSKKRIITIFVYEETSWAEFSHCPHTGAMSPADCILYWATLLGHFRSDPHSMLVAVKGSSDKASMLLTDLTSKTKELGLKNIFHNCVFPFDNSGIVTVQQHLNGLLMKFSKEVKLSWLMFHDALSEVSEWPWISYKLVKQVASIFQIGETELVEVMEFWSNSSSILYKDTDCLNDVVFRNTVWLAGELSKVLHLSHSLNPLLKDGIVEQCVVEQHWLSLPIPNSNSTMHGPSQLMLDYLISLNLMTLVPRVDGRLHHHCNCYFLPSLLKAAPDVHEKNQSSLFVSFSQSFVPLQIFSQIVILLLRDKKLPCGLKNVVHQYSNKITLCLEPCCTLILTEHPFVIELTYECSYCSQPKEEHVKLIRNSIKACCSGLQLDFKFHLLCPNDAHYISVPNVRRSSTHCPSCTSNVNLTDGQLFWIVEQGNRAVKPTKATSTTLELTEEYLVELSRQINARDAHQIAIELGFFDAEYEHILSFGQDKRVVFYLLITWLDRSSHLDNKNEILDQALIATGYRPLATSSIDLHTQQKKLIEDSDLRILAEHIDTSWQTLAFFFDVLSDQEMSRLKKLDNVDAAYCVLKQWYQNFTGLNPHKQLVTRLHNYDPSLASHYEHGTLNTYQSTSRKRFL